MITWNDFEKIGLHSGTIIDVKPFPEAKKPAYQLTIDFGSMGIRNSSAQITQLYLPETLIGKTIIAVLNFPVKKIANFSSECLVLGVHDENGAVTLLTTDHPISNGSKVC
ncbi:MAG: tRNA-binding protein [Ferruginibacter sp.]